MIAWDKRDYAFRRICQIGSKYGLESMQATALGEMIVKSDSSAGKAIDDAMLELELADERDITVLREVLRSALLSFDV